MGAGPLIPGLTVASILSLGIAAVLVYIVRPLLFSPLSKIPTAHPTSRFCWLWIYYIRWAGLENTTLYHLHQAKGPILRLGPNELSINCYDEGVKTIYIGGFDKPEYYFNRFSAYGAANMVSMMHSKEHSVRRRMFANVFSKSKIFSCPSLRASATTIIFERLLPVFSSAAKAGRPVEIHSLTCAYALDLLQAYQFGMSLGSDFLRNRQTREWHLSQYFARIPHLFWISEFPTLVSVSGWLGMGIVPQHVTAARTGLEAWFLNKCDAAERLMATELELRVEDIPIVYVQGRRAFAKADQEFDEGERLPAGANQPQSASHRLEIASDMLDFNAATLETSGDALVYIYYELSRHRDMQERLRQELHTLSPSMSCDPSDQTCASQPPALPDPKDVDELPLLDAIIQETLRLYPAAEGGQPRVTPSPPCSLAGFENIPPGVRVQSSAYSLHRNPDVFPEPEAWRPARWLDASPAQRVEMKRWFWAFGSGSRMCIGNHLARYSIKYAVAAIYSNFTSGLEKKDFASPVVKADGSAVGERHNLYLRFRRVDHDCESMN
ncbi:uncharacterized protein L3040_005844 [Drepanopeziza brunnea f. sp. 'multigermtubi']|uniref:uncharacterized protein n=1 Tax=Drepanopeziza brunnea f. sp. 'multigermtubi' TaxID=698441 RepID=UPI002390A9A1|nr:hypothetical protein L3040_005844 [Drepanopeziza brunnea f. sp. 'multigermtubi']